MIDYQKRGVEKKMKTYTNQELTTILELHKLWLKGNSSGVKANLSDANLSDANLSDATLRGANLSGANLSDANLSYANLSYATLRGANLSDANLSGANLSDANLSYATLRGANLSDANLRGANLSYATLRDATLRDANLNNTIGNNKEIKSLQIGTYLVTYTKKILQIGCKQYTIDQWFKFDDNQIASMDYQALDWWEKTKPLLQMTIDLFPAE
jgi:Pentapeptide repeats (8 copies)